MDIAKIREHHADYGLGIMREEDKMVDWLISEHDRLTAELGETKDRLITNAEEAGLQVAVLAAANSTLTKEATTWREAHDAIYAELKQEKAANSALSGEVERLSQRVCDECDGDGWVQNRVEGRGACTCMVEAEPFAIIFDALENIRKASTGEIQIADDDTEGMQWIAKEALKALAAVWPLDYAALAAKE